MTNSRLRRPGVTLLEVLVAIFVMAIGLLALLTLFPIGAIQMAQAVKDDRTAGEATHADALVRSHFQSVYLAGGPMAYQATPFVSTDAFDDPQAGFPPVHTQRIYPDFPTPAFYPTRANPTPPGSPPVFPPGSPSYPVMLDGLGYFARTAGDAERSWVGKRSPVTALATITSPPTRFLIPRRSALGYTSATPTNNLIEAFALTDDLTFEKSGAAAVPLQRQGWYNWAAMVQLPRHETRGVAKLTIMVFNGRPSLLANAGDEMITTTQPFLTVGDRTMTIVVPNRDEGSAKLIRRGGWIMDSTISPILTKQNSPYDSVNDYVWIRNANFYRISGLTDLGPVAGGNQFALDLETPIKPLWNGRSTYSDTGNPLGYTANVTLFAGLSEVFVRADLRPDPSTN